MNPGLVVKLRPAGPWRIGPDSGARNRVDVIYHSDSLYSAVTGALARLGSLEEWLDATARVAAPAVCFSSCFPFLEEIGFVIPPRTIWPPTSPALMSARVRWKSARFVPLGIVQAILAGQTLHENHWSVDGPSECLVPAGRPGPFRTGVRFNAAVDRLTGSTERHSTACIEFRQGSGLWTIVSFRDEAAHARWSGPVKAAFRLLADTGFGGERSRGWGRAEAPEFIEGTLPDMILPPLVPVPERAPEQEPAAPVAEAAAPEPPAETAAASAQASLDMESEGGTGAAVPEVSEPAPETATAPAAEETPAAPVAEPAAPEPPGETAAASAQAVSDMESEGGASPVLQGASDTPPEPSAAAEAPAEAAPSEPATASVEARSDIAPLTATPEPAAEPEPSEPANEVTPLALEPEQAPPEPEPAPIQEPEPAPEPIVEPPPEPVPEKPAAPDSQVGQSHWLLSLFTPASSDAVDWRRGSYTMMVRGGRVDSPAGSGELKKQLNMVAEGSVVLAATAPCGAAPNVAPDGFAHPVFRAGFALSIPLPPRKAEVS